MQKSSLRLFKRPAWSQITEKRFKEGYDKHGMNAEQIKEQFVPGISIYSIRKRICDYNEIVKGPWSAADDLLLMQFMTKKAGYTQLMEFGLKSLKRPLNAMTGRMSRITVKLEILRLLVLTDEGIEISLAEALSRGTRMLQENQADWVNMTEQFSSNFEDQLLKAVGSYGRDAERIQAERFPTLHVSKVRLRLFVFLPGIGTTKINQAISKKLTVLNKELNWNRQKFEEIVPELKWDLIEKDLHNPVYRLNRSEYKKGANLI